MRCRSESCDYDDGGCGRRIAEGGRGRCKTNNEWARSLKTTETRRREREGTTNVGGRENTKR